MARKGSEWPLRVHGLTVKRLLAGDVASVEDLYNETVERLIITANRIVRDISVAEQLALDTFSKVHRVIDKQQFPKAWESAEGFERWLRRVIISLSLNHLRDEKKKRGVPFDFEVDLQQVRNYEEFCVRENVTAQHRKAFDVLSSSERELLELCLSYLDTDQQEGWGTLSTLASWLAEVKGGSRRGFEMRLSRIAAKVRQQVA